MGLFQSGYRFAAVGFVLTVVCGLSAGESAGKAAIPDSQKQSEAKSLAEQVFGNELADAKTPEQKKALAKKFEAQASQSKDDPTGKYVLLSMAKDLAAQANDARLACDLCDELALSFDVNAAELAAASLKQIARKAKSVADSKAIAECAVPLIGCLLLEGNFKLCEEYKKIATAASQKTRDPLVIRHVRDCAAAARKLESASRGIQKAKETLQQTPDDSEANLAVGRYLCFCQRRWDKGLPMLAKSGDAAIQKAAAAELRGAQTPAEQIALADAWWNVAESEDAFAKIGLYNRASHWYGLALPSLTGLENEKAAKRQNQYDRSHGGLTVRLTDLELKEIVRAYADNEPLLQKATIDGIEYESSIFTHPADNSSTHVATDLYGRYQTLRGAVGIHDRAGQDPSTKLGVRVVGDGKLLWQGELSKKFVAVPYCVDVSGVKKLELFVDCPGYCGYCSAFWVNPVLTPAGPW
jgi:hypothetical protein